MPCVGIEMQFNTLTSSALQSPGIFVVMFADYGDIASVTLTGVQFNYACKSMFIQMFKCVKHVFFSIAVFWHA